MAKIRERGVRLKEYAGVKPYRGVLTGFNEAFLIDTPTRDALIHADPRSEQVIKPYLRGQDIKRWVPEWAGLWMIALKSSGDHPWPWADLGDEAETCFTDTYPGLHHHLKPFEDKLRQRQDRGRYWWELRSCAYWNEFESAKIFYQEIQYHPAYCLDSVGVASNNKAFFIASADRSLLSILNSPLMWWHNWRYLPHMKDEALTPVAFLLENLPVQQLSSMHSAELDGLTCSLFDVITNLRQSRRDYLDWLLVEHGVSAPSTQLQNPIRLTSDELVREVQRSRGRARLTSAALRSLREEYTRTIEPAKKLAAEALQLEYRLHDLVNEAYGLTPEEVRLMWDTAPPRMPIPRPPGI
jgi:hypothetical protein